MKTEDTWTSLPIGDSSLPVQYMQCSSWQSAIRQLRRNRRAIERTNRATYSRGVKMEHLVYTLGGVAIGVALVLAGIVLGNREERK